MVHEFTTSTKSLLFLLLPPPAGRPYLYRLLAALIKSGASSLTLLLYTQPATSSHAVLQYDARSQCGKSSTRCSWFGQEQDQARFGFSVYASTVISKRCCGILTIWPKTGFGVNESGAEFGSGKFPGVLGTDYIWPDTSTIQTLRNAGMNIFRVPFAMERLVPNQLTGSADATYMSGLKSVSSRHLLWLILRSQLISSINVDRPVHHLDRRLCRC